MHTIKESPVLPIIPNTAMTLSLIEGVPAAYYIAPNEGYVLHDKLYDSIEYDNDTMEETGNIILGYRTSTASCSINYDFEANPREFYTILKQ